MSAQHSTPNDDNEIVDANNASSVRYWAHILEVDELVLRLLIEQRGSRVADLGRAIHRTADLAEDRRSL